MRIDDLIQPDCIVFPLEADSPAEAITKLVNSLAARHHFESPENVAAEIVNRENQVSTVLVPGVAFPHARSNAVSNYCMALGKLMTPLPWSGPGIQPVEFVMLFVVPDVGVDAGVMILRELSDIFLHEEIVLEQLRKAETAVELYNTILSLGSDFDCPAGLVLKRTIVGHHEVIHSLSWSPDGSKLVSGAAGKDHPRVWDGATGELIHLLRGHSGSVYGVGWSADGSLIATGSADKSIRIWNVNTGTLVTSIDAHEEIYDVDWAPTGRMLASAGHSLMVRFWDGSSGTSLPGVQGGFNIGYCVRWSPDGRRLASGTGRMDPSVKIWNALDGQLEKNIAVSHGAIFAISWKHDGERLAAGSADGRILVFDTADWQLKHDLFSHSGQITALAFSHDGGLLASKADDGRLCIWDTANWTELGQLPELGAAHLLFHGLAFHPRLNVLASLGHGGRTIRLWEVDREEMLRARKAKTLSSSINSRSDTSAADELAEASEEYHVFLCHNNMDKDAVRNIAWRLRDRGISPWLDEWAVPPGRSWLKAIQEQIQDIQIVLIFVGANSVGPWQQREIDAIIQQFVKRDCTMIPVLLPECEAEPELPPFLTDMKWVDFRKRDPDPIAQLIWGITGIQPPSSRRQ